jgi:membrane associated rhomboid family serine protease
VRPKPRAAVHSVIPIKDNIPVDRFPFATVALIVANIVVFFTVGDTVPKAVTVGTVFGALFIQASVWQLIGNMWFLWLFGNNIEDSMGPLRFIAFYLVGGMLSSALAVAIDPGASAPILGAAGAVATVIGGYLILYPHARVLALVVIVFFFGVLEIPTAVMLGLWVAMQIGFAAAGWIGPGAVAYMAWIGGFAFGLLAIRLVATRQKPTPPTAAAYR